MRAESRVERILVSHVSAYPDSGRPQNVWALALSQVPAAEQHNLQKQIDGAWMFMLVAGKMHVGLEIGEVGSVRYVASGKRRVAMLPLTAAIEHMQRFPAAATEGEVLKRGFAGVRDWVLSLPDSEVEGLSKLRLFYMDVQEAGELLYIPPGWVTCELAEENKTASGWRTGVVVKSKASIGTSAPPVCLAVCEQQQCVCKSGACAPCGSTLP